jgi:hypothetical protein
VNHNQRNQQAKQLIAALIFRTVERLHRAPLNVPQRFGARLLTRMETEPGGVQFFEVTIERETPRGVVVESRLAVREEFRELAALFAIEAGCPETRELMDYYTMVLDEAGEQRALNVLVAHYCAGKAQA